MYKLPRERILGTTHYNSDKQESSIQASHKCCHTRWRVTVARWKVTVAEQQLGSQQAHIMVRSPWVLLALYGTLVSSGSTAI